MANRIQLTDRRQHHGFGRFMAWWQHELSLLIPNAWKYWYCGIGNMLTVSINDEHVQFHKPQPATLQEVGRINLVNTASDQKALVLRCLEKITGGKTYRLYLCLPAGKALRRKLSLPLAAEENIRQTLAFELDRQTPFKPDQIYFDYKILERNVADQHLFVELIVLPKEVVEDQIRRAAALGLPVTAAVLEQDIVRDGDRSPNFLPTLLQPKRSRRRTWLNLVFLGLTMALLAAAIAIPLWQKREQAIALNVMMMGEKKAADRTDKLRSELDALVAEHNFPIDQKNARVSTFVLLNELSKLLPDDTWVFQFDLNGVDLQIQGETGSSSKLIEKIENSSALKSANYKSPLTQLPGTTVERFHLAAETRSPAAEKAAAKAAQEAESSKQPQAAPVAVTTSGVVKNPNQPGLGGKS